MQRSLIFFLLFTLAFTACAPVVSPLSGPGEPAAQVSEAAPTQPAALAHPQTIIIFADESLKNAFTQMVANVQAANPGLLVDIRYGDTQSLREQIEQGAQADVFAAASQAEMTSLIDGKAVDAQAANVFLVNQLVFVLPALTTANLSTLQDLTKPGVKVVLAADQTTLGKFSQQALDNLEKAQGPGYKADLLKNVISYEQDTANVLNTIQLGRADAGLVYASDLAGAPQLQKIAIPYGSNVVAQYSLAVLSKSANPELARIFVDYVLSPRGQDVLQVWGFMQDR